MLVYYLYEAIFAAAFGYIASGLALVVRLQSIRRTHPLAKAIPRLSAFASGVTAVSYVWSDAHRALGDRWVDRWVVLNRIFAVAAGVALLGWGLAASQAGY